MLKAQKVIIWTTGIAIFSMFFGAGNVIFPIALGQQSGTQLSWALAGLLCTAIGGPLLGLFSATLFEADTKNFFRRIGNVPGYLLVLLLLILLGPVGAMPRCITVSYAAMQIYFPSMSLFVFSLISGVIILLCIARRDFILKILGDVLSPILIISLLAIIFQGLFVTNDPLLPTSFTPTSALLNGLEVGYGTMDLIASIFFSAAIWNLLSETLNIHREQDKKNTLLPVCFWASLIGGISLGLIYLGLSYIAGVNATSLVGVNPQQMLSQLAVIVLGDNLAIIANIAIALACLTTVISLAVTVADVVHNELNIYLHSKNLHFNYLGTVLSIVFITVMFSNLGFDMLMSFIMPVIKVCYPAIIVLTICNIFYKLYGFRYVKFPFYGTLLATVVIDKFDLLEIFYI